MELGEEREMGFVSIATSGEVVWRSLGYGVVVGAVLIGINHGDALWRGDVDGGIILKLILTPIVPYIVSTLSSVSAIRDAEVREAAGSAQ